MTTPRLISNQMLIHDCQVYTCMFCDKLLCIWLFAISLILIQRMSLFVQALQDKVGAASQRTTELETQLSNERERAVSAEEHGRSVERQLAEEQQNSDRTAKKREEAEAELAAQVTHDCRTPIKWQRPTIADSACLSHLCSSNLHACMHCSWFVRFRVARVLLSKNVAARLSHKTRLCSLHVSCLPKLSTLQQLVRAI